MFKTVDKYPFAGSIRKFDRYDLSLSSAECAEAKLTAALIESWDMLDSWQQAGFVAALMQSLRSTVEAETYFLRK